MARAGLAELNDPLVLDLDGDGLTLSALTSSHAYFDLSGSGFAVHTGWVAGGDGYTDGGELKTAWLKLVAGAKRRRQPLVKRAPAWKKKNL